MCPWLSWIERLATDQEVGSSNLLGHTPLNALYLPIMADTGRFLLYTVVTFGLISPLLNAPIRTCERRYVEHV